MKRTVLVIVMLAALLAAVCALAGCSKVASSASLGSPAHAQESSASSAASNQGGASNAGSANGSASAAEDAAASSNAAGGANASANAAENATASGNTAENANGNTDSKQEKEVFTLKVGFDPDNCPYSFEGDGEYVGLDVDLAYLTCRDQGWNLELIPIEWSEKDALLEEGIIDCVWSSFTREWREDKYALSTSYYLGSQVILVKKNSVIDSKGALNRRKVAVQQDSLALDVLQLRSGGQLPLANSLESLRVVEDIMENVKLLDEGVIDAIAIDNTLAQRLIYANPYTYRVAFTLYSEHYAVAFKKGNEAKAKAVSESLERLNSQGFMEELCLKYARFGTTYSASQL